jgi:hypothetical protein
MNARFRIEVVDDHEVIIEVGDARGWESLGVFDILS